MTTPISSYVKYKNNIFTARDEDTIFQYEEKSWCFTSIYIKRRFLIPITTIIGLGRREVWSLSPSGKQTYQNKSAFLLSFAQPNRKHLYYKHITQRLWRKTPEIEFITTVQCSDACGLSYSSFQQIQYRVFTWRHSGHIAVPKQRNAAILVYQTSPQRVELYFYAKTTFCLREPIGRLAIWVKPLYTVINAK